MRTVGRFDKDAVSVTVRMKNGSVVGGDVFVLKQGQRLQDMLNDGNRQFLPLRSADGKVVFINRDCMEMITHEGDIKADA
jgi:hypothetical protein